MDPDKIQSIYNFPVPKNVKQHFIGMVGWYGKFIPDFQRSASHKKEAWSWAFIKLKTILTQEPILAYPDLSQPFAIHTDASDVGLRVILLQEQDGLIQTIAYASRSLNTTERNYSTTEKECLAVIWALDKVLQSSDRSPSTVLAFQKSQTDGKTVTMGVAVARLWCCIQARYHPSHSWEFSIHQRTLYDYGDTQQDTGKNKENDQSNDAQTDKVMNTAHESKISDDDEGNDADDCAATACTHPKRNKLTGFSAMVAIVGITLCVSVWRRNRHIPWLHTCTIVPHVVRNDGKIGKR